MPVDLPRIALLGLATARLTRLLTTDTLPEYLAIGHFRYRAGRAEYEKRQVAKRIVNAASARGDLTSRQTEALGELSVRVQDTSTPMSWQARLQKGIDCPFCMGFWIGGAVLVGDHFTRRAPSPARGAWTLGLAALALNYVVGHVSSRID